MAASKIVNALEEIDRSGLPHLYLNEKFAATEQEIMEAENRLESKFPESYRFFLKLLGSGDFQGTEFYGLIPGDIDREEIPNGLWFTQDMQENLDFPKDLFAVENFDGDAVACLLLSSMEDGECPVILWDHSEDHQRQIQKPYVLAKTFGDYFFNKIKELIEDEGLA